VTKTQNCDGATEEKHNISFSVEWTKTT